MRQPQFQGVSSVSAETLELNIAYSKDLNYPAPKAMAKKLAIVGGGFSVTPAQSGIQHLGPEFAVWGINGAAAWCLSEGIDATLFTISPCKYPRRYLCGVRRAILAHHCDPWLFDALKIAKVFAFDTDGHGPTSVCAALHLAMSLGFEEVHLFGCEGNYSDRTHLYQDTPSPADIVVRIGGDDYHTNIGYFMQTQLLAKLVREASGFCKNHSGGMLAALAADPDGWDVIKLPSELKDAA